MHGEGEHALVDTSYMLLLFSCGHVCYCICIACEIEDIIMCWLSPKAHSISTYRICISSLFPVLMQATIHSLSDQASRISSRAGFHGQRLTPSLAFRLASIDCSYSHHSCFNMHPSAGAASTKLKAHFIASFLIGIHQSSSSDPRRPAMATAIAHITNYVLHADAVHPCDDTWPPLSCF